MRPLEGLLLIATAAAVPWGIAAPRPRPTSRWVGGGLASLAVLGVVTEPWRWQLVPLHLVVVWVALRPWTSLGPVRWPRLLLAAAALGVLLPVLVPVPDLPDPGGPFAVGTATTVLTDATRTERYGPDPGSPRRIPVHVWYPAEPSDAAPEKWLDTGTAAVVAEEYGLPAFFLDHVALVDTSARSTAAPVDHDGPVPVILYSHGWGGFGRISPDQPERLAAHGYVVVAPDHTYGALVAALPDGPIRIDPGALPEQGSVPDRVFDEAAQVLVATYAADLRFLLDSLAELEAGLGLDGLLDTDRIGIYGHSTGGGAAVAACATDSRCDAVLGFDPWVEPVDPEIIDSGLAQPFLAIRSEEWLGGPNDGVLRALHGAGSAPSILSWLHGADHNDFVALAQISPLASTLGFKGAIPGPAAREVLGASLVAFFDRHLGAAETELPPVGWLQVDGSRG